VLRSDGKCCEVREGEGDKTDKWKISLRGHRSNGKLLLKCTRQ
jgi:hypothetical protein